MNSIHRSIHSSKFVHSLLRYRHLMKQSLMDLYFLDIEILETVK